MTTSTATTTLHLRQRRQPAKSARAAPLLAPTSVTRLAATTTPLPPSSQPTRSPLKQRQPTIVRTRPTPITAAHLQQPPPPPLSRQGAHLAASAAATNQRLRQGALYARRHQHGQPARQPTQGAISAIAGDLSAASRASKKEKSFNGREKSFNDQANRQKQKQQQQIIAGITATAGETTAALSKPRSSAAVKRARQAGLCSLSGLQLASSAISRIPATNASKRGASRAATTAAATRSTGVGQKQQQQRQKRLPSVATSASSGYQSRSSSARSSSDSGASDDNNNNTSSNEENSDQNVPTVCRQPPSVNPNEPTPAPAVETCAETCQPPAVKTTNNTTNPFEDSPLTDTTDDDHLIITNNISSNNKRAPEKEDSEGKTMILSSPSELDYELCEDEYEADDQVEVEQVKQQQQVTKPPDMPIKTEPITDHYDLEARPFARGKFAQVKRCVHKKSKQCFAAKCIKKRRRLNDIRNEILLEISALKLSHYTDRIVKLYEVYETPSEIIFVLEMAKGGELQRVLDDEEVIAERLVKRMVRQILDGLIHLHDNDIAHLDIKPQNLLLTEPYPNGDILLCDFGISRRISKDCEIREICGTPDYVAPEILSYDPISLATDMWSLGVLTYVLLSGYSPFAGDNKQETFCNITQAVLDFPSEIFDTISNEAIDFMQKLILREPTERLTSRQARKHPWLTSTS